MRNKRNNFLKLIFIGFLIIFTSIINPIYFSEKSKSSETESKIEETQIELTPFIIDDSGGADYTWAQAALQLWCNGSGTIEDPYIIQNIFIDVQFQYRSGIEIRNSNKYFIIKNSEIIHSSSLTDDHAGIKITNTENGEVQNLYLRNNEIGMIIRGSNNKIYQNQIFQNNQGIRIEGDENFLYENVIKKNDFAIFVQSNNNRLYSNNYFLENLITAQDDGMNNKWDNGLIGNFWDDYRGYDQDYNEIGDTPYEIFGSANSNDSHPIFNYKGLRYSNKRIQLLSPENKTYNEPMSGYYLGTFNFDNPIEEFLYNPHPQHQIWYDARIVEEIDGHRNVLELGGDIPEYHRKSFPSSVGTIEFWMRFSDESKYLTASFFSGDDMVLSFGAWTGKWKYRPSWSTHPWAYFEIPYLSYYLTPIKDQWHHIKIDFRCNGAKPYLGLYEDTFIITIDGICSSPLEFHVKGKKELTEFRMYDKGNDLFAYEAWIDAFGCSWDSDYSPGNNFKEGMLLNFEVPEEFEWTRILVDNNEFITIFQNSIFPMYTNGRHSIQIFGTDGNGIHYKSDVVHFTNNLIEIISPKDGDYLKPKGYFLSSIGFENGIPSDLFLKEIGGTLSISPYLKEHNYVLKLEDQSDINQVSIEKSFDPITSGTIEFWIFFEETNRHHQFMVLDDNPDRALIINWNPNGQIDYDNGAINIIGPYQKNRWYHVRVEIFDTESWSLWINGNLKGIFDFKGAPEKFSKIQFKTSQYDCDYSFYIDAIGLSWDPNYQIGNNLIEGLNLFVQQPNQIQLKSISYSIDGGEHIPINGSEAIPFPDDGLHYIQVIGDDSNNNVYRSTTITFNIHTIEITFPEEQLYFNYERGFHYDTFHFESSPIYQLPQDWVKIGSTDPQIVCSEYYIDPFKNPDHQRILRISRGKKGSGIYNEITTRSSGTIEFWWYKSSEAMFENITLELVKDTNLNPCIKILYRYDVLQYLTYDPVAGKLVYVNLVYLGVDKWYHIRIDFEFSDNGYLNLGQNEMNIWVDQNLVGSSLICPSASDLFSNEFDRVFFRKEGSEGDIYIDAIGYSWDPAYEIGDNYVDDLCLDIIGPEGLIQMEYSLDGREPVPVYYDPIDALIPVRPEEDGTHTIQVYGYDDYWKLQHGVPSYQSEIITFRTLAPISQPGEPPQFVPPVQIKPTLICVHGFSGRATPHRTAQFTLIENDERFKSSYANIIIINYYGWFMGEYVSSLTSISEIAHLLALYLIEHCLSMTSRIDFIGHSMGGLIIRDMIKNWYDEIEQAYALYGLDLNIGTVCIMATPNHGAFLGIYWDSIVGALFQWNIPNMQARDFAIHSYYLGSLNTPDETPYSPPIRWYTYSAQDDWLVLPGSVKLKGAINRGPFQGVDHDRITKVKRVIDVVYNDLTSPVTPSEVTLVPDEVIIFPPLPIENLPVAPTSPSESENLINFEVDIQLENDNDIDPNTVFLKINPTFQMSLKPGTESIYETKFLVPDGLHSYSIVAEDYDGNHYEGQGELFLSDDDTCPPAIKFKPDNYIEFLDSDVNKEIIIEFEIADHSGLNQASVFLNNKKIKTYNSIKSINDTISIPNIPGEYEIKIWAKDNDHDIGHDLFEEDSLEITTCAYIIIRDDDSTPPEIIITYKGSNLDWDPGFFNVDITDYGEGLDEIRISIDDVEVINEGNLNGVNSRVYQLLISNSLGIHKIEAFAQDNDMDHLDDSERASREMLVYIEDDDISFPEIDIQYIGSGFDNDPGYFNWSIFDLDSGINEINITVTYQSTEALDDYFIDLASTEIGSWDLPPNLGIYTIEISVRDNDDDRTLIVDSLITILSQAQEIVDDDVDPPELSGLVIIPDTKIVNVTFTAIDESGIGNITVYINGILVEPLTQIQYGNNYTLIFENHWTVETKACEVVIYVEDGDVDRPNDALTSSLSGAFKNVLWEMYEYVFWQLEELKSYIEDNLCHRWKKCLIYKLTQAQGRLTKAFDQIADGNITRGLCHNYIAKIFVRFAEIKTELLARRNKISDEITDYIILNLHEIRNNIVLLMGASTGSELAHELGFLEVELLNLHDFIEQELPCCVGKYLSRKIWCASKMLEITIFRISEGEDIDCLLRCAQCMLEKTMNKIDCFLERGKISEAQASYLIGKILEIMGKIESLPN